MPNVMSFQKELFTNYNSDLSLPEKYNYLHGNPVQPVVPLDTADNGVFIIGAYPSAKFASIGSEWDVPVNDLSCPFSTESYFDGSRVRTVDSGRELEEAYLTPLGLKREECWITNLVRIFLFKDGHVKKYRRLGCDWPVRETRSEFETFALQGMHWLEEELSIAKPQVIITLGAEVVGILQGVKSSQKRNDLLGGDVKEVEIGSVVYPVIHFAHPGIVMRKASGRNPWPRRHLEEHIPEAKKALAEIIWFV
jgi:uracil-DNA glycosylase